MRERLIDRTFGVDSQLGVHLVHHMQHLLEMVCRRLETTENVAPAPSVTVRLEGCVVIFGATTVAVTVSVAEELVSLPAVLLTIHRYVEPLSVARTVAAVV